MHLHEFFVLICIRICMNLYVCVTYVFYGGLRRRGDLAHHMYLHLSLYLICIVFVLIVFSLFSKLRRRGDQTHHFCMCLYFYGWLRKRAIRHTICIAYCICMYLSLCGRIRDTACIYFKYICICFFHMISLYLSLSGQSQRHHRYF